MSQQPRVTCTIDKNSIAIVSLNRPEKMNAIDMGMFDAVKTTIKKLKSDRSIRAVIVKANGDNFCSGLDVKSLMNDKKGAAKLLFKWWPTFANDAQFFSVGWRTIPCPVIFALHGRCWGGGLQLASGGDFRFAHPETNFSIMEGKWGLIPDMGGALAFRELMRQDNTLEMAMTAKIIDADTAKEYGLVTRISEQPFDEAYRLALECADRSPDAVAATKKLYNKTWWSSPGWALWLETWYQIKVMIGKNRIIAAKREKQTQLDEPKKAYMPRKFQ
ncbi:crotonase/enoyl-CoA hydratase family protein [Vibrio sp. SCSIO 43136]|uniref:crotonase/enoyl-CoA hydratase family protein n=1 Tax=Vibrio sp. SCSIO 43136 TaxID=2819101 RepID=UPI0020753528|nr:crotonase/enoyl-CoA hydratase family protein [Vibrio sp. SCSIO 43136]USD66764.1 crotonase/enoyl-CoA hydratase family protein [Vibrio sp. SCSIO 43136]